MTSQTHPDHDVAAVPPPTVAGPPTVLPGLSIVLPCLNEAANVADAIRAAASVAGRTSEDYEILVVDDGSTDATAEIASRFVDGTGRVRLLIHPHNRGYGAAMRTGIAAARMPWVLLTDADLQFDLGDLEDFVMLTGQADVVAGRRVLRQDTIGRRINGAAWSWLMRTLFDLPVRDVDCAFKLIRRELLEDAELTATGALISAELLVVLRASGARIVEHGVRHRPRVAGEPTGARLGVILRAVGELAQHFTALRQLSHPARG
jgi:glycosyltransferase involved in cell wall biosynthesis